MDTNAEIYQLSLEKIFEQLEIKEIREILSNSSLLKDIDICLSKGARLKFPKFKLNISKNFSPSKFGNLSKIFESATLYDFLIENKNISLKDKANLDTTLLLTIINDIIFDVYKNKNNPTSGILIDRKIELESYDSFLEIKKIIYRGNVFQCQNTSFLTLSILLGYLEIFDNISAKIKVICYNQFTKLNLIGKKALVGLLIKNKNEEALFNLLHYGLKLDWEIKIENKKNIFAFEMLSFSRWVNFIFSNKKLNIKLVNSSGENILHNCLGFILSDHNLQNSLRRRIDELSSTEKTYMFNQFSNEGLSPMMKAVLYQDDLMIEFIKSFNVNPWDEVDGAPIFDSPLSFLNDYILDTKEEGSLGAILDMFKENYWINLAKKWNAEYFYLTLQQKISNNKTLKKEEKNKI